MRVDVGSFVKAAAVGNQDVTIPVDLTAAADGTWAIMFWTTTGHPTPVSGTWQSNAYPMIGFVAKGGGSISEYSVSDFSYDNQVLSNTSRRTTAKAITFVDVGETLAAEASFVSFPSSTAMRLNWTTNSGFTTVINYMIFSGLTGAKVVNWTTPITAIDKAVTGVGFNPDLVLHAFSFMTSGSAPSGLISFGTMNKQGQQWANAIYFEDAVNPARTARVQRADSCFVSCDANTDTIAHRATFKSMDADGFTTKFASTIGSAYNVISLCLDGISSKLGAFLDKTAAGAHVVPTRHGFTPKGALFSGSHNTPSATAVAHGTWHLGGSDFINHRAGAVSDVDAVSPTNAESLWRSDATILHAYNGGNVTRAAPTAVSTEDLTLTYAVANAAAFETLYALFGDANTDVFPTTVTTDIGTDAVQSDATAVGNQKKVRELSTGRRVSVERMSGSSGTYALFSHSSDGKSWTYYAGATILGWVNGSIHSYVDSGGTERLVAVWKQSGVGGGRTNGYVYIAVGTFDVSRTTLTWGTPIQFAATDLGDYPDLVSHSESTGGRVHVVATRYDNSVADVVWYWRGAISSGGVLTEEAAFSTLGGAYGNTLPKFPSIDIDPSTKRLHVAWSAGTTGAGKGIRYRTASYSAGAWTWAAELEIDNTQYTDGAGSGWVKVVNDPTYGAIIVTWGNTGAARVLKVYQRDQANTTTTLLYNSGATTTATRWHGGSFAVSTNGDIHLFGNKDGTSFPGSTVEYMKFTRTSSTTVTAGTRLLYDETGGNFTTVSTFIYATTISNGIAWVYVHGNAAPYTVRYDQTIFNVAPNTPTNLLQSSPTSDTTPTFSADISDADTGQQIKARFELYQNDGVTLIGTVDSSLGVTPHTASAEYSSTLPVGTYKVRAKAIDAASSESGWTALVTFYITTTVSLDRTLLYDVKQNVSLDTTVLWDVLLNNVIDIGLMWDVTVPVVVDVGIQWADKTIWVPINPAADNTWVEVLP